MEDGTPVSACHRSGSVNVETAMGTTRTRAPAGSRSAANVAAHPAGTGETDPAGSGRGTIGAIATSATAATAHRAPGHRAAGNLARAASIPNANIAAAAPSATIENRSGITDPITGSVCSQYQGSLTHECSCPPPSRVPPMENTSSTANVTAAERTVSRRQNRTATAASTISIGQPR